MEREGERIKKKSEQCCCEKNRSFTYLVTYAILVLFLSGSCLSIYVFSLSKECMKWDQQSQKNYLELFSELQDLKRKVYSPGEYIIRRRDSTTEAQKTYEKSSMNVGNLQKQYYGRSKRSEDDNACKCKGEPGLPGPFGRPGLNGYPGPPGMKGLKGETGIPGFPGEEGQSGPKGERGEDGYPGPQGLPGTPGFDGITGQKGQKGELGYTGPQGFPGEIGPRGAPGPLGLSGVRATYGDSGPPGYPGSICRAVGQNNNGWGSGYGRQDCNISCQCPPGPQGEPGLPGEKGEIGSPGRDGSSGMPGVPGRPARPAQFEDSGRTVYPGMICRPITKNDKGGRLGNESLNSSVLYQCPPGPQGPPGLKGQKGDPASQDRFRSTVSGSVNDYSSGGQGYYPWAPKWSNNNKT